MGENDKILHEDDVKDVVSEELEDLSTQGVIADLAAPSSSYVQAEATATKNAVNGILASLRDAGIIPTS